MKELLSFQDIYYAFKENGRFIKESGHISPGSILVIHGPSGAGKSTLLKILARLIKADGGSVFLNGKDWNTYPANEWRLNVHYVSQQPVMFEGTGEDNLLLPFKIKMVGEKRSLPELNKISDYLDYLGLDKELLNQPAKTLSGGEKARIALLRAVLIEPLVLLLDEPSAYLDQDSRKVTMQFLNQWSINNQGGIIMVSHSEEDLNYLDNYTILNIASRRHTNE